MYNVIAESNGKVYTLQENGGLCSTFNYNPKKYSYMTEAKRDALRIKNNNPHYSNVAILDLDSNEKKYV